VPLRGSPQLTAQRSSLRRTIAQRIRTCCMLCVCVLRVACRTAFDHAAWHAVCGTPPTQSRAVGRYRLEHGFVGASSRVTRAALRLRLVAHLLARW
jgi:hypothetical protein